MSSAVSSPDPHRQPGIHRIDLEEEDTAMYIIYDAQLRRTTVFVPLELAGPETEEHIRRWLSGVVPLIGAPPRLELVRVSPPDGPASVVARSRSSSA